MMVAGSFHGTRMNGTVSVRDRLQHRQRWFISTVPCWRSTQRVEAALAGHHLGRKPWAMDSQPNVAHLLSRQISLILFARIAIPSLMIWESRAHRSTSTVFAWIRS